MTARTVGGLTGVSHLDRFLHFDNVGADVFPLDIAAPYFETDNPPILIAFFKRDKRTASRSIRGPTGSIFKRRTDIFSSVKVVGDVGRRKQVLRATANLGYEPDHLDKLLSFDSIPADFLPLDIAVPYIESGTPPCIRLLISRGAREALAKGHVAASVRTQRRSFYFSPRLSGRGGARRTQITGRGYPPEGLSCVDDFLSFDSTPADFVPLDRALPYREGYLLWR
jgi:hypothetical protein